MPGIRTASQEKSVLLYLFISKAIKQIVFSNFIQTFFSQF